MGKGLIFIGLALFIDGFQAFMDWALLAAGGALSAATPLGAGAAGFAAGYVASSNAASGAVNCVLAGAATAAASPFGIPIGIALGFVVNFIISATFGVMLVVGLAMFGFIKASDWKVVAGGGLAETIPGLDCLPGWTLMTVRCVIKKEVKQVVSAAATSVIKLAANDNAPQAANDNTPRVGQEVYA